MPHLVNRKFGCFSPTTTLVNGAFAYNFDYLESTVGRRFDVFSTFLDLGADYPGNPSAPATRKQHSEIISTVVPHFHRPPCAPLAPRPTRPSPRPPTPPVQPPNRPWHMSQPRTGGHDRPLPLDPLPGPRNPVSGEEGELVVHPKGLGPPLDGLLRGPPRRLTTRLVHRAS